MKTEFVRAILPRETRSLMAFDRKAFSPSDRFDSDYWRQIESYWMLVDGIKAGCCAFEKDVDFEGDIRPDRVNPPKKGSLYIATTGVLPRFRGMGFGRLLKAWEISFARYHGFKRLVTNVRQGNRAIIALNQEFNFKPVRTTPGYYSSPVDSTMVMELKLD